MAFNEIFDHAETGLVTARRAHDVLHVDVGVAEGVERREVERFTGNDRASVPTAV